MPVRFTAHVTACLQGQGYGEEATASPLGSPPEAWTAVVDRFYFDDWDRVQRYGYFWDNPTDPAETEPSAEISDGLSQAYELCTAEPKAIMNRAKDTHLDGDFDVELLDTAIGFELKTDLELQDLYGRWATCMDDSGFPGLSMSAEVIDPSLLTAETAIADYRCRQSLGLPERMAAARARLVAQWISDNPTIVQAIHDYWADIAAAATDLAE